jgi:predicted metalloprotease
MKWERGHKSKYVEDVRGQRAAGRSAAVKVGGGGAIVLALVALIAQALGVNLPVGGGGGGGGGLSASGGGGATGAPPPELTGADKELYEFINYAVDDIQDTFTKVFANEGLRYQPAVLKVFADNVDTACGSASSAVGPFYCPADSNAYIDMTFYRDLRERFGAPGDFAQAYVLAHEYGHHIQNLLGTDDEVRRQTARDKSRENELSVRQELQADCYAGIWAHGTAKKNLIEAGDIEESIRAAQAIGDDRLQKMAGQRVNPETFTHGSSAQRARWFKRGFEAGRLGACDTFAAADL